MSMQDTVADMLTRIRNAQMAQKASVTMPSSKLRKSIADLLVKEGYVATAETQEIGTGKTELTIELKYFEGNQLLRRLNAIVAQVYVNTVVKMHYQASKKV